MNDVSRDFSCFRLTAVALLMIFYQTGASAETYEAIADIHFRGSSTLHHFEGTVAAQPLELDVQAQPQAGGSIMNAALQLKVSDVTTHRRRRDKNMYKMFDMVRFPFIEGAVTQAVLPAAGEGIVNLRLTIRDQSQVIEARITNWSTSGNAASFDLTFPVSLKAFGLNPPSALGVIRVGDTVEVECHIRPAPSAGNSIASISQVL